MFGRSWLAYGSDMGCTPNMDSLAERGILVENSYSVAPWTRPWLGRSPQAMRFCHAEFPSVSGVRSIKAQGRGRSSCWPESTICRVL
jgi:arylsulfatase A-like enzyme